MPALEGLTNLILPGRCGGHNMLIPRTIPNHREETVDKTTTDIVAAVKKKLTAGWKVRCHSSIELGCIHYVYIVFHGLAKCVPYLFWTLNPAYRSYSNDALNA